ncbi:uncharacterized protein LOC107634699 isoform X1 [Arachis ipaensis]|uniref:uncharacterized protein LOC107634699 isoform X1 n=1 Tax=Arachis ipaensis TaxID=130454 RepID=UPI0007AF3C93|nr:uncharacterized protein LOC107634699 isoform X1 [Arachis ipaensis]
MYHSHQYPLPCLYCHPHSYIRMVQNLIERCLLFHMSQDQCIKALAEHAGIKPLVTLTGPYYINLIINEFSISSLCTHICIYLHVVKLSLCYKFVQCGKNCKRRIRNSLGTIFKLLLPPEGHSSVDIVKGDQVQQEGKTGNNNV